MEILFVTDRSSHGMHIFAGEGRDMRMLGGEGEP